MPLNMLVKVLKYALKYALINLKNIYLNNNFIKSSRFSRDYQW